MMSLRKACGRLLFSITCWFFILLQAKSVKGVSCYTCSLTTTPLFCFPMNCAQGASCFTQAWIQDGVTYYQQGCFATTSFGTCDFLSNLFCTPTNTFHCCKGDNCNTVNPMINWTPKSPKNLIPVVDETSIELIWDPICIGNYRFDVEYAKIVGGTTAGQVHTTLSVHTNSIKIYSLAPATNYLFRVTSHFAGDSSPAETLAITTHPTTPGGVPPSGPTDAKCWITDKYFGSVSSLYTCPNRDDSCFARIEYFANTSERLTSRGCMSNAVCQSQMAKNLQSCRPGEVGASCNFCCKGLYCNTVEWLNSGLSCDDVHVKDRILCGWRGIPIGDCLQRGCCYIPSNETAAWCYHGKYPPDTGSSPALPIAQAHTLNTWMIVLIVAVILCLIILAGIVTWCCLKRKRERESGSYDVYAVPKRRGDRRHVNTVSRRSYDNMVVED